MLKRVNVHLEESVLKELDAIIRRLKKLEIGGVGIRDVTRADLIRFALSRTYGVDFKFVHASKDAIWSAILKSKKPADKPAKSKK